MQVTIPCICGHHEQDTITLRDRLDFRRAVALRNALALMYQEEPDAGFDDVLATLTDKYLQAGIESWSLQTTDAKERLVPLPVSYANIRDVLMAHIDEAMTVGDAADDLYTEAVMLPLLLRGQRSSSSTPTKPSTSQTKPSSDPRTRRKPSSPSSITTIPTVSTETTSSSLDGGSSLSPSSESAA